MVMVLSGEMEGRGMLLLLATTTDDIGICDHLQIERFGIVNVLRIDMMRTGIGIVLLATLTVIHWRSYRSSKM